MPAATKAARAIVALAVLLVLAAMAASCSSAPPAPPVAQAPAQTPSAVPAAPAADTTPSSTVAEPSPTAAAPTVAPVATPRANGPLLLGAGDFQQASFPDEAAQLAIEALGEPTRTSCGPESCSYEWDLPEHASRFAIDDFGWALWGEPLIASIDDRMVFANIGGDPTEITKIIATDPYTIFYQDGQPSELCSLTVCFSAVAGNSQFGPADAARMGVIYGRSDSLEGRATVIGSDPVPFYNDPGKPYTVVEGQELWIRPGFLSINGTYWVDVITDDHRGVAIPMDRLVREGDTADMLAMHRSAQQAKTVLLTEQFGPLDILQLRSDGVGPVDIGGSADDAIDIVIAALGEPTVHVTSTRSSPEASWVTAGGDVWLNFSDDALSAWHIGDFGAWVGGDGPPARPLSAIQSISIEGAAMPLTVAELDLTGPWGAEDPNSSVIIRSASGYWVEATTDGLITQLRAAGKSPVTEMWFSQPAFDEPLALAGLNDGERVLVDQRITDVGYWRGPSMAFVYTQDHRAGWVSAANLSTEQP